MGNDEGVERDEELDGAEAADQGSDASAEVVDDADATAADKPDPKEVEDAEAVEPEGLGSGKDGAAGQDEVVPEIPSAGEFSPFAPREGQPPVGRDEKPAGEGGKGRPQPDDLTVLADEGYEEEAGDEGLN